MINLGKVSTETQSSKQLPPPESSSDLTDKAFV